MRTPGVIDAPTGLTPGDHVCWLYDDEQAVAVTMAGFLREGVEAGERVSYVSSGSLEDVRRALRPLGDVEGLLDRGVLEIHAAALRYAGGIDDPAAQVRAYAEATDRARRDGFGGLRVAAEVTALVTDAAARRTFCEYEHLVDRYMREHPFTALCCYDRRALGEAAAELSCLHPLTNDGGRPFRCFAGAGGTLELAGEVDASCAEEFARALQHVVPVRPPRLSVDARALDFIDHHGLAALAAAAERVELRTRFRGAQRLARLLELDNLDVRDAA